MSHLKDALHFKNVGFGSGVQNEGVITKGESIPSRLVSHYPKLAFVYLPFAFFVVGYIDLDLEVVIDSIIVKAGIIDKMALFVETICR